MSAGHGLGKFICNSLGPGPTSLENNGKGLSHELGSCVEGLSCDRGSQRLAFADVTAWLMPKDRQGGPRTAFNWHGWRAGKCPCLGWNNLDYIFASFACLSTPRQLGISTSQAARIRGAPLRMREAGNVISEENPFNIFSSPYNLDLRLRTQEGRTSRHT